MEYNVVHGSSRDSIGLEGDPIRWRYPTDGAIQYKEPACTAIARVRPRPDIDKHRSRDSVRANNIRRVL